MTQTVDRGIILMAGRGTRFLPATKAVAKELFPIENKPALLYHLEELYNSGIKKVCIVISKEKDYVKTFLSHDKNLEQELKNAGKLHLIEGLNKIIDNMEITFIYQGKMSGSGGALLSAKTWTENKPFVLILGDDLCKVEKGVPPVSAQMAKVYEKTQKCVVGAKPFPMDVIHNYSSIVTGKKLFERCFEMNEIIEKPEKGKAPSNLVGLARYVMTNEIFDQLKKCPVFTNNELRFTDAINLLAHQNRAVCYEFDAKYYDCGNKLEYIKFVIDYALEDDEISSKLKDYIKNLF